MGLEDPVSPLVVGIGGTVRSMSMTEQVLRHTMGLVEAVGVPTRMFTAHDLLLPMYGTAEPDDARVVEFLAAVSRATALVIATPAYHGGVSGLIKNALDYLEELRGMPRPYLDGRTVGCIVTAQGMQSGGMALSGLRNTIHALRGWPTPMGLVLDTRSVIFDSNGLPASPDDIRRFEVFVSQVTGRV